MLVTDDILLLRMNLFSKLEEGYENLWKMVVRPPRCTYPTSELGP